MDAGAPPSYPWVGFAALPGFFNLTTAQRDAIYQSLLELPLAVMAWTTQRN